MSNERTMMVNFQFTYQQYRHKDQTAHTNAGTLVDFQCITNAPSLGDIKKYIPRKIKPYLIQ